MNKSIKIAKQIIKMAKSLIAQNDLTLTSVPDCKFKYDGWVFKNKNNEIILQCDCPMDWEQYRRMMESISSNNYDDPIQQLKTRIQSISNLIINLKERQKSLQEIKNNIKRMNVIKFNNLILNYKNGQKNEKKYDVLEKVINVLLYKKEAEQITKKDIIDYISNRFEPKLSYKIDSCEELLKKAKQQLRTAISNSKGLINNKKQQVEQEYNTKMPLIEEDKKTILSVLKENSFRLKNPQEKTNLSYIKDKYGNSCTGYRLIFYNFFKDKQVQKDIVNWLISCGAKKI